MVSPYSRGIYKGVVGVVPHNGKRFLRGLDVDKEVPDTCSSAVHVRVIAESLRGVHTPKQLHTQTGKHEHKEDEEDSCHEELAPAQQQLVDHMTEVGRQADQAEGTEGSQSQQKTSAENTGLRANLMEWPFQWNVCMLLSKPPLECQDTPIHMGTPSYGYSQKPARDVPMGYIQLHMEVAGLEVDHHHHESGKDYKPVNDIPHTLDGGVRVEEQAICKDLHTTRCIGTWLVTPTTAPPINPLSVTLSGILSHSIPSML